MVAAHESGHPILASYAYKSTGANNYSWIHKRSINPLTIITIIQLKPYRESDKKGYEEYPGKGADLMKYYSDPNKLYDPLDFHSIEYDIKALVWLSKLTLKS